VLQISEGNVTFPLSFWLCGAQFDMEKVGTIVQE